MPKKSNVDIVSGLYAAFGGDPAVMVGLLQEAVAPDIVVIEAASLPYGGTWNGLEGLLQLLGKIGAAFDNFSLAPQQYLDAGDHVIALLEVSGTSKKTGRTFHTSLAEIWKFDHHHKVVSLRPFYLDTHAIVATDP